MNTDIKDYVWIFKNEIDDNLCHNLVSDLEDSFINWEQHTYRDHKTGEALNLNANKELDVTYIDTESHNQLMDITWNVIDKYIKGLGFDWFAGWAGFSAIRYNRYRNEQLMSMHCDHIQSIFDGNKKGIPTLSILHSLNDDYVGGDFLMWDDEKINFNKGDIMVFPSNFLYPHRVTPVTKGVRYSAISWAF